jgi:hypothetical protein
MFFLLNAAAAPIPPQPLVPLAPGQSARGVRDHGARMPEAALALVAPGPVPGVGLRQARISRGTAPRLRRSGTCTAPVVGVIPRRHTTMPPTRLASVAPALVAGVRGQPRRVDAPRPLAITPHSERSDEPDAKRRSPSTPPHPSAPLPTHRHPDPERCVGKCRARAGHRRHSPAPGRDRRRRSLRSQRLVALVHPDHPTGIRDEALYRSPSSAAGAKRNATEIGWDW